MYTKPLNHCISCTISLLSTRDIISEPYCLLYILVYSGAHPSLHWTSLEQHTEQLSRASQHPKSYCAWFIRNRILKTVPLWNVSFYQNYILKIHREQVFIVESMLFMDKISWGKIFYTSLVLCLCLNTVVQTYTMINELVKYALWVMTSFNKLMKRSMTVT